MSFPEVSSRSTAADYRSHPMVTIMIADLSVTVANLSVTVDRGHQTAKHSQSWRKKTSRQPQSHKETGIRVERSQTTTPAATGLRRKPDERDPLTVAAALDDLDR